MGVLNATAANVSCACDCTRLSSVHVMDIMGIPTSWRKTTTMQPSSGTHNHDNCVQTQLCAQLEFVQILVIVVVMMVMVVVITCLLNHYRLSARSLLSRHTSTRRRHLTLAHEAGLWSSEGAGPSGVLNEQQQQAYNPRPLERGTPASYLLRDPQQSVPQRFQNAYGAGRFQPTYPYLPQDLIDLPPTISLSDGEEPPPYQGPCTLQLRDPEQQMELNRESVRAPPNRTVFDSHPLDTPTSCMHASLQAPPPSVRAGISALEALEAVRQHKQEGAPPTYSEVIGHYYHPRATPTGHAHQAPPSSLIQGVPQLPPPTSLDRQNARNTEEKS
ncbi:protein TMEPAI isoform X1 [Nerophis lumbriciformis]|uniref:protein TMEPAI isoform X1 n=1 Tax=Nerophis lumbriciformis TaxID=546530 RepID=UPI002ADFF52E|nr:protein TMEPAI-like isoform X1 [Nerophis lumbriciformis]